MEWKKLLGRKNLGTLQRSLCINIGFRRDAVTVDRDPLISVHFFGCLKTKRCKAMNLSVSNVLTTFCLGLLLTNSTWGAQLLWFDASDTSTIEDSFGTKANQGGFLPSDVTTWLDKSPAGNHAALQGGSPTWMGAVQNGLDVLDFEQMDSMSFPAVSSTTTGTNPGMTAFIVVKSTGVDMGNNENFDVWLGNSGNGGHFMVDRGDYDGLSFGVGGVEGRAHADLSVYPNNVNDFHIFTAKI